MRHRRRIIIDRCCFSFLPRHSPSRPSSSAAPYVVPVADGVLTMSLLTVGDSVNLKPDGTPHRLVGSRRLGAYDRDGTFTLLMTTSCATARARSSERGAFVSEWTIRKTEHVS
jgi:hypothetical protein